jgi:hypothetical protein
MFGNVSTAPTHFMAEDICFILFKFKAVHPTVLLDVRIFNNTVSTQ